MANISVSGLLRQNTWLRPSAAAYGCAVSLLVTFALDELAVSQATEHQSPERTYQAIL